jgi:hypothetical protein
MFIGHCCIECTLCAIFTGLAPTVAREPGDDGVHEEEVVMQESAGRGRREGRSGSDIQHRIAIATTVTATATATADR